jgi:transposase-like protein
VRWYCKYGLSYRDLTEMMQERGVSVDPSTIFRWVQRDAPESEKRVRQYQGSVAALQPALPELRREGVRGADGEAK